MHLSVCLSCPYRGKDARTQRQYSTGWQSPFYVHASVQKRDDVKYGGGRRGWLPWLQILALSLFLSPSFSPCFFLFIFFVSVRRLLVLSVGVGIDGLVYELNPVGLSCRKSELGDREGFTWARAVSY